MNPSLTSGPPKSSISIALDEAAVKKRKPRNAGRRAKPRAAKSGAPKPAAAPPSVPLADELEATREALRTAQARMALVTRRLEETSRAHEVFVEVSRDMLLAKSEEEVVDLVGRAVRRLLPGRRYCLRIVSHKSLAVTSSVWDGASVPRDLAVLRFKRSAFRRMGLPEWVAQSPAVEVADAYAPVFEGTRDGFAMPLVAAGELFGLLNIEYLPDSTARREEDGLMLRPLVNQTSVVLRKIALLSESMLLQAYLEQLIENANAPIVVFDTERKVRVCNQELARLTGYPKDEVVGRSLTDLLPREERQRFMRVLINSLRGEPTSAFETRVITKLGRELRLAINAAPVFTDAGDVDSVIVVGQDLTKLRDLERQILHAEKLATIGQLAAGVVHEVNTPLTSISVWAEYLFKKLTSAGHDGADLEKLRRIIEGAERIRHFTSDLTVYARPAPAEPTLLGLNDIVRHSVSFCEHLLEAAGVKVFLSLDPSLPKVFGVYGQLQQVFINLITNACDAVSEAGGRIEVTSCGARDRVAVIVSDDGVGLREGDSERVFEPFFTTKPPGKGTGLGLSIVRDIVDSHGGDVTVESRPGQGAKFRLEFPVGRRRVREAAPAR
jgi:PAS domain S-box-containing protein